MGRSSMCWLQFCTAALGINPACPDRASIASLLLHFASLRTLNHPILQCTPPTCKVPHEAAYPSQQERLHRGSLMSMCNIAAELAKDILQSTKRPSTKPA